MDQGKRASVRRLQQANSLNCGTSIRNGSLSCPEPIEYLPLVPSESDVKWAELFEWLRCEWLRIYGVTSRSRGSSLVPSGRET